MLFKVEFFQIFFVREMEIDRKTKIIIEERNKKEKKHYGRHEDNEDIIHFILYALQLLAILKKITNLQLI